MVHVVGLIMRFLRFRLEDFFSRYEICDVMCNKTQILGGRGEFGCL
jgi:hypothetical protein